MKRFISLLLSGALLLALCSACQPRAEKPDPSGSPASQPAALDVVDAVFLSCGFEGRPVDVEYLTMEEGGDGFLAAYLENAYGLTEDQWEDAAVIRATGASAFELAVLRLEDENAAVRAATVLMSYISNRQGDFAGYAPAEADMVAKGGINQAGHYASLFICPDTDSADAAFKKAVSAKALPASTSRPEDAVTDVKELCDRMVALTAVDGLKLERLDDSDSEALSAYVADAYGLGRKQWTECAIARGAGDSAFEVAVIRAVGLDVAWEMRNALNNYLDGREEEFAGSAGQKELLHQALSAVVSDTYVVLLACPDAEQILRDFADGAGFEGYTYSIRHPLWGDEDPEHPGRTAFIQPNEDDMSLYDTSAILAAWEKDDPSGLSSYDRDVYDAAKKVLDKILEQDMSDLEKETAIYRWVVNNVWYDWTHQDAMKETPRESFTPYGGLVNHKALCLGYATTFQLLCDLAGVECITVPGAAFESREDHGWNMVRLDGEWYCVDATWDANVRERGGRGRPEDWDFFNVTSDDMAASDHQWDYANTPEATAADGGRG